MDKLSDKLRDKMGRTFAGSATSALAALLMVGVITVGATVVRPMLADRKDDATTAQAEDTNTLGHDRGFAPGHEMAGGDTEGDASDKQSGDAGLCENEQGNPIACDDEFPNQPPKDPPADEPADEPKDEPMDEPKDTPKDEPHNNPPPAPSDDLTLAAVFLADYGKIVVEWSAFGGDFDKYKVVRSTDGDPTWPQGDGDELVAVVGAGDETRFKDTSAPCNTEVFYRAFAVRHTDSGYQVLASSNVGTATRQCDAQPPADPKPLAFEVTQTADGVLLSWESCPSDAFVVYKVVRSATNPDPKYPLNDGTELIGVIGDPGETTFVDTSVELGQTWTYRVLSMGQNGDGWYVLGLTAAWTLTVE